MIEEGRANEARPLYFSWAEPRGFNVSTLKARNMNFPQSPLTNLGLRGLIKWVALAVVSAATVGCSGYPISKFSSEPSSDNSEVVNAANAEIDLSNATGSKDTQCSDFVASVLRRLGYKVEAFQANEFNEVAARVLPAWQMTEFTTENLESSRAELRHYLNSYPDHTAFFAQWPRVGQSGHVAIVEKIAADSYLIFQAQAGLNTPYRKAAKVESILYGTSGVDRSKLRLWAEQ